MPKAAQQPRKSIYSVHPGVFMYEQLMKLGFKLGKDVRICPCETIIPFYRNHDEVKHWLKVAYDRDEKMR